MQIEHEVSFGGASSRFRAVISRLGLISAVAAFILSPGCSKPQPPQQHPPTVTVAKPVVQNVTDFLEYPSTLTGIETVDIRARVEGFLQSIEFKPRQIVQPNQLLFVIEPTQYKAQVDQATANVNKAKADQKLAETTFVAEEELYKKGAEAKYTRDQAEAKVGVAKGEVDQCIAALEIAQNNFSYTQVVSPINGRVSRNLVDVGNLVGAGEKTLLTTVVNDSKVYAYFNISENDVLAVRKAHPHAAAASEPAQIKVPVFMGLADELGCPHVGRLDFINNEIDTSTGTLQLRAIFDNDDHMLLAGMYAKVRVPVREFQGMLLPDTAIMSDQGGKFVLRVNDQNVVEHAKVSVGKTYLGMRVIVDGIKPEDRIVTNGMQKARPGTKVAPEVEVLKQVQMPTIQSASQPAGPQTRPAGAQSKPATRISDEKTGDLQIESLFRPAGRNEASDMFFAFRQGGSSIQQASGR